jgi:hypothetical protein
MKEIVAGAKKTKIPDENLGEHLAALLPEV